MMAEVSGVPLHAVNLGDNPALVNDEHDKFANGRKDGSHGAFQAKTADHFALFSPDSIIQKQQHNAKVAQEYGFLPARSPTIEDGSVLPDRFEPVSAFFYDQPIEEIETGIRDQTFCILARKFRKTYIHRFPASNSCLAFSPWNPVRKACIAVVTNQYFEYLMMVTVIVNFIFYLFGLDTTIEAATSVFLIVYIIEMILKIIAYGFALGKYTYLRNPWNWLDLNLNIDRLVAFIIHVGNFEVLRMFRLFRILSHFKDFKPIFGALSRFTKMFFQITTLTIFCLSIFALFGVDTFKGLLRHKCGIEDKINHTEAMAELDRLPQCIEDCGGPWALVSTLGHTCGNGAGSYHCEENYTCLEFPPALNPNHGYTSFDDFGSAMLTTFQIMTLNNWNDVYDRALSAAGPYTIIFFILIIFLGTFYLLNLFLAALIFCCEREKISQKSTPNKSEINASVEESAITGTTSTQGLVDHTLPDHNCACCSRCCVCYGPWVRFQRLIERFVTNCCVDYFFIACIILNTIVLALNHHNMGAEVEYVLRTASMIILVIFTIELTLKVIAFSRDYFRDSYNIWDFVIVLMSLLELALENIFGISVLRGLRVLRILRLSRTPDTSQPKTPFNVLRLVVEKTSDLINSVCYVLFITAMIFGVLGRESIGKSYHEVLTRNGSLPSHLEVTERLHFLDSVHAVFLIFRVMFGDWIAPLTECMKGLGGQTCTFIIFPALILGKFLILGVCLALIITTFTREEQPNENKQSESRSACARGWHWVKNALYSCCTHPILSPAPGEESKIRRSAKRVIDSRVFGGLRLFVVLLNCVALCLENVYLGPFLYMVILVLNGIFCAFFIFELIFKLIAHGFHSYFTTGSTILEFVVVLSILLLTTRSVKFGWSVLRALVVLRLATYWPAMKMMASLLVSTIPSILYVCLISCVFWSIFAILGIQLFAGRFLYCVDEAWERAHPSVVPNITACDVMNYTWVKDEFHFDDIGSAVEALLQIATFERWEEVTSSAVDTRGEIHLQPATDNNIYMYAFFFIFLLFGVFYPAFLFVGIIIANFNNLAKKYEGGIMTLFLSERWRKYSKAMSTQDGKPMERPSSKIQSFCYDLSVNIRFELFMLVIILINMICMIVESYGAHVQLFRGWSIINLVFTIVLVIEAAIKITGMRRDYFKKGWNLFDFLVVVFAVLDIVLLESLGSSVRIARELRLVRLFRFYRIPRVEKVLNIGKLLSVITKSFPAHLTLSALLFLVMFAYAIIGTLFFRYSIHIGVLNQVLNFDTVGHSMIMLFRMFSSGFWYDVLLVLGPKYPFCEYVDNTYTNCCLGCTAIAAIFIISYIIINFMIITIYTAVIIHNFKEIYQQNDIVNDIDMYFITWTKYDPAATQFISLWKLPDFLHCLDFPFRIAKPNGTAIASFNFPIATGQVVHCMDILTALLNSNAKKDKESENLIKTHELAEQIFMKYFPLKKQLELDIACQEWNKDELAVSLDQNASNQ